MRLASRTDRFHVYDDVLPPEMFKQVWHYVQNANYEPVHSGRWAKVWRLSDGLPFQGSLVVTDSESPADATAGTSTSAGRNAARYPTHTGIDHIISLLLRQAADFEDLIGVRGVDWEQVTAMTRLYPAHTGLSWHLDGPYAGAYTFYAHPRWNCQWGGELMVADVPTHEPGKRLFTSPPHLDNGQENDVLSEVGMGCYIAAKPNRLVVLRKSVPHRIQKVDAAAGDQVRCTVSGFFVAKNAHLRKEPSP